MSLLLPPRLLLRTLPTYLAPTVGTPERRNCADDGVPISATTCPPLRQSVPPKGVERSGIPFLMYWAGENIRKVVPHVVVVCIQALKPSQASDIETILGEFLISP
jgi:hypothetical protein